MTVSRQHGVRPSLFKNQEFYDLCGNQQLRRLIYISSILVDFETKASSDTLSYFVSIISGYIYLVKTV